MLDVHILIQPDIPREWVEQCLESVSDAAACAGYPVYVHVLDGVAGHIGKGRSAGYARGDQPYVTYVDNDDYVLPSAFAALGDAFAQSPDAIFPAESTLQNGHLRAGQQRHHLCVYRRSHLFDHAQWLVCGDLAQMTAMRGMQCIEVPERVYVHRLYQSDGRALRRKHPDEWRRAHG